MALRIPKGEPEADRIDPGDHIEYSVSAPTSAKSGAPWVKVAARLQVREGEGEEDFMERLCSFVHESLDAQIEGLR